MGARAAGETRAGAGGGFASPSADRTRSSLFAGALALLAASCSTPGEVHPRYAELKPERIAVPAVRNETARPLDEVSFDGLLQRSVLGARTYDIPNLLRGALEESLIRGGYAVVPAAAGAPDPSRPAPEGAPKLDYDAALVAVIEAWRGGDAAGAANMSMRYRIALFRVPTAEVLYQGTFSCEAREDLRNRGADEITSAVRRSAARALAGLPPAVRPPEAPPPAPER